MERKKMLWMALVLASIVLLTVPFESFAGVAGSDHDFSITGSSNFSGNFTGDDDEVCVYCHTPHAALGSQTPLWNKALSFTNGFTMYSSSTMDATVPAQPSTISLLCLSCHDGVGAINSVLNAPGPGTSIGAIGDDQIGDLGPLAGRVNIGEGDPTAPGPVDLSNDHPVSIQWAQRGPGFYANPQDPRLELYNGQTVECTTCHDPHNGTPFNPGEDAFLRMSNQGSAMCLACHIK